MKYDVNLRRIKYLLLMNEKYMSLRAVKAGQSGKVIPTTAAVNLEILDEHLNEIGIDDALYYVDGESQAPEGIHTGNILLAHKIVPGANFTLRCGNFIVLQIAEHKLSASTKDSNLKLRKFIKEFNLSTFGTSIDSSIKEKLWEQLLDIDIYAKDSTQKKSFINKLDSFLNKYTAFEERSKVLVSITYTSNGREYSFHPKTKLESIVKAFFDEEGNKHILIEN